MECTMTSDLMPLLLELKQYVQFGFVQGIKLGYKKCCFGVIPLQ